MTAAPTSSVLRTLSFRRSYIVIVDWPCVDAASQVPFSEKESPLTGAVAEAAKVCAS